MCDARRDRTCVLLFSATNVRSPCEWSTNTRIEGHLQVNRTDADFASRQLHGQFHCAFNLFADNDSKRLAVNVLVTQGTSEISLRHSCMPNRPVISRVLWVKRICRVRFQILHWNHIDCRACPIANVRTYGNSTSFQSRKMHLRVTQGFFFNSRPQITRTSTYNQLWLRLKAWA